ncbi:hypothetical protein B2G71_17170 [Novosphingobium sp. PC22D]|uniref:VOC family protein n=1 Tax=Novosphingobium sp. PC22D TaxID=1962403 RepID=UPI000BF0FD58|nr:VOC family protein [Novosphingobium sp. PC22D]PEQ11297.1 hypothetical protein B2G71_17170 [Novosphingobium sp. PC22D]
MRLTPSTPACQAIIQNAYHVRDVDEAVERFHALWGIGPFIMRRRLALEDVRYHGTPSTLSLSAAHAQIGDLQIELVQQHGDEPSAFRDMFAAHEEGLHHMAILPADHDAMVAWYAKLGFPAATELTTREGRGATYVDTRPMLGHMIEVYRPNESLLAFYRMVEEAARDGAGQLKVEL